MRLLLISLTAALLALLAAAAPTKIASNQLRGSSLTRVLNMRGADGDPCTLTVAGGFITGSTCP